MKRSPGIRALLDLEESKYSIEQIAAKTGTSPAYIAGRVVNHIRRFMSHSCLCGPHS
jgi:hypothetical protein